MEKRALVAVVVSLAIWIVWFQLFPTPDQKPVVQDKDVPAVAPVEQLQHQEAAAVVAPRFLGTANVKEEVTIDTALYKSVMTNKNADSISFVDKTRNIELIVRESKYDALGVFDFPVHFSTEEFLQAHKTDPVLWNMEKRDSDVRFSIRAIVQNNPLGIEKKFAYNKTGQYFTVSYSIVNRSRKDFSFPEGRIIYSPADFLGPSMDFESTYNDLYSVYFIDDSYEKKTKGSGFFSEAGDLVQESGVVSWAGIMSRYYLIIMIPQGFKGSGIVFDNREHTGYRTGIVVPVKPLKPGESIDHNFKIYVGPKKKDKLLAVDKQIGDAADVSKWIEPIRDFMMWCLLEIDVFVGNLGWSLVIFSIITKIIFLPLTQRSAVSMKKMQELNPVIQELREKYKDKPDALNKKIWEVYKKNKVNPLGGCLPLLLQMPFFIALYSAFVNSVDLWQAPFILWINDLSLPDTVYTIAGFNINILPIVMTGTTYLMQKMTTGEATQHQKIMMILPLLFIVIFWNMPSGLVLYWTMQNVLQIGHQMYVNKKTTIKQ